MEHTYDQRWPIERSIGRSIDAPSVSSSSAALSPKHWLNSGLRATKGITIPAAVAPDGEVSMAPAAMLLLPPPLAPYPIDRPIDRSFVPRLLLSLLCSVLPGPPSVPESSHPASSTRARLLHVVWTRVPIQGAMAGDVAVSSPPRSPRSPPLCVCGLCVLGSVSE